MQRILAFLTAILACALAPAAEAAHTEARLILSAATAKPGDSITAAMHLKMDPGWHTYWKNPGASGQATKIEWQLPAGVTAGEIQWLVPEKFVPEKTGDDGKPLPGQLDFEYATYVFHDETALLVPLKLAADLRPGPLELKAKVSWLECEIACVPGEGDVKATLEIGSETRPSGDAGQVENWRKKLPKPAAGLSARAEWEKPARGDLRPLFLEWQSATKANEPDFFPDASDEFEVQPEVTVLSAGPGKVSVRKTVKKLAGDWPKQIQGVLVAKESDGNLHAWEVKLPIAGGGNAASVPFSWATLLGKLGSAFLGGLILNIMPCVFPVIALKIFGFVQQSRDEPRRVFALGLIYALGVLTSFLVMAGLVIAIKQAGGSASWGMQFKSPQISVGFIAVVVLIALNLFGVFEVNLGGGAMGAAGQLASQHGSAGAFFNGVLATILATPCTAPILASALGFAFAQPPLVILLFFLTIGLGLAFPYVLLSWKPGWLKFLPRPGAWMEKFKVAMGFPILATAVWIFWFTAPRFGDDGVIWIGFFLIGLAFAAWIWGAFVQRGGQRRGLAMLISIAVFFASYAYALESRLHWRSPAKAATAGKLQNDSDGVQWQRWSADAVAKARSESRPVLVDFTAKWCLTCNTLVKPAVDNRDVRRKLDEINGVALLADNTDYPADVMAELKKYHSDSAVPLVLVYSRDAGQPPMVLPTIPTRKDVLDALTQAAQ